VWHWKWRKHTAKKLLKDSWPMILSGMAISIYMKIDQVMIKEMLDAKAVGNYAAAVRLSETWYFIPMSITSSVFPAIINAKKQGEKFYYQRLQKLYDLMVWLAVLIALPTTFLATWVIKVLYGEAFLSAAGVLRIHIWAGVFVFLNNATWRWHLAENNQKIAFVRLLVGALFNILFNSFLIKEYGIVGAAWATLLSYSIAVYWGQLLFKQSQKIFLLHTKALLFGSISNIIIKNSLILKK
jgi:O-antigen/teichoic acid export membrane protein